MKKIIIYNETLLSGGIEKCIELLITEFHQRYEFEIVYLNESGMLDITVENRLKKYANVHKLSPEDVVEGDICLWCRSYMDWRRLFKQIHAKKNYLWVHSKPREDDNSLLDDEEFLSHIDEILCVSQTVRNMLNVNTKSRVIYNFIPNDIKEQSKENILEDVFTGKDVNLVMVGRISVSKGFDRITLLLDALDEKNIDYNFVVVGKGRSKEQEFRELLSKYPKVTFVGYKDNPYSYIARADYLVLLSTFETWGNVITEAKALGIPAIVTNFPAAYEQIEDDVNGVVIDMNTDNYIQYIDRIVKNKEKYRENLRDFKFENDKKTWEGIFDEA